ncbi:MAG: hypothetical protein NTV80_02995 [Verrucomicrobia bacterium]|nr:hypothetical protein [Verrucomicrobiota bacterium]
METPLLQSPLAFVQHCACILDGGLINDSWPARFPPIMVEPVAADPG